MCAYPGKNVRWDPANPTWDPVLIPGGIPGGIGGIPGGIPTGIMERLGWDPTRDPANPGWDPRRDPGSGIRVGSGWDPGWDPDRDYGTPWVGSQVGSRQSWVKSRLGSHLFHHGSHLDSAGQDLNNNNIIIHGIPLTIYIPTSI